MIVKNFMVKTVIRNMKKMKKRFPKYKMIFFNCTILYVAEIYEYMYPVFANMNINLKGVDHNKIRLMVFDETDTLQSVVLTEEEDIKLFSVYDIGLNLMGRLEVFESVKEIQIKMSIDNKVLGSIYKNLSSSISELYIERKVSKADYRVFKNDKIVVHSDYFAEFNSVVIPEYAEKKECLFIALAMQLMNTPDFLEI